VLLQLARSAVAQPFTSIEEQSLDFLATLVRTPSARSFPFRSASPNIKAPPLLIHCDILRAQMAPLLDSLRMEKLAEYALEKVLAQRVVCDRLVQSATQETPLVDIEKVRRANRSEGGCVRVSSPRTRRLSHPLSSE
jgi:hypothetical protein